MSGLHERLIIVVKAGTVDHVYSTLAEEDLDITVYSEDDTATNDIDLEAEVKELDLNYIGV